jgi:hypothetical protein
MPTIADYAQSFIGLITGPHLPASAYVVPQDSYEQFAHGTGPGGGAVSIPISTRFPHVIEDGLSYHKGEAAQDNITNDIGLQAEAAMSNSTVGVHRISNGHKRTAAQQALMHV